MILHVKNIYHQYKPAYNCFILIESVGNSKDNIIIIIDGSPK